MLFRTDDAGDSTHNPGKAVKANTTSRVQIVRVLLTDLALATVQAVAMAIAWFSLPVYLQDNGFGMVAVIASLSQFAHVYFRWKGEVSWITDVHVWLRALLAGLLNWVLLFASCHYLSLLPVGSMARAVLACSPDYIRSGGIGGLVYITAVTLPLWIGMRCIAWARRRHNVRFPFLECALVHCSVLDQSAGIEQVIDLLEQLDASIPADEKAKSIAFRKSESGPGKPQVTIFGHRLLQLDAEAGTEQQAFLSYRPIQTAVTFLRPIRFTPKDVDTSALGALSLARLLYARLQPEYGFIYKSSFALGLSMKEIGANRLERIFWANFLGPGYVRNYGREFLLNAPGWKIEELEDGGILYVTTESFTAWEQQEHPEILMYFRSWIEGIEQHRVRD